MADPFTVNKFKEEVFTKEIIDRDPVDLMLMFCVLGLRYDLNRIENAILNTFCFDDAQKIITSVNIILQNANLTVGEIQ